MIPGASTAVNSTGSRLEGIDGSGLERKEIKSRTSFGVDASVF